MKEDTKEILGYLIDAIQHQNEYLRSVQKELKILVDMVDEMQNDMNEIKDRREVHNHYHASPPEPYKIAPPYRPWLGGSGKVTMGDDGYLTFNG